MKISICLLYFKILHNNLYFLKEQNKMIFVCFVGNVVVLHELCGKIFITTNILTLNRHIFFVFFSLNLLFFFCIIFCKTVSCQVSFCFVVCFFFCENFHVSFPVCIFFFDGLLLIALFFLCHCKNVCTKNRFIFLILSTIRRVLRLYHHQYAVYERMQLVFQI